MKLVTIPVAQLLEPKHQVRSRIDDQSVQELAESIKEIGLLQPIVVRAVGNDFEIIAGHRRYLAIRRLGFPEVECLLIEESTEDLTMAQRLHENLYRVDLTPLEEAAVYAELYEELLDTDLVAMVAKRSRETIERRLKLLELDDCIREALEDKTIGVGVAELLQTVREADTRAFLLDAAIRDGASIEKVRLWVKDYRDTKMLPDDAEKPGGPGALSPIVENNPLACWLCGSAEDPHDMRVKMVHAACERMARRQAEDNLARAQADGNP